MNKNKMTGAWEKTKGKVKEEVGHATGNSRLESEGLRDQVKGKVEKRLANVKDAVKKGVDILLSDKKKGGGV